MNHCPLESLVIDAGSVTVGLILLRLEIEVPAVDPDASLNAVILVISLLIRFVCLLVPVVVSRLVLAASARGATSFFRCEPRYSELLPFHSRLLSELLQR
jgi:hypothetical protein